MVARAIRVSINGVMGRMGREVLHLAVADPAFEICAALEHSEHSLLGKDAGVMAGVGALDVYVRTSWEIDCDVLIDFSLPDASLARVREAADNECAVVLATTGFSDDQKKEIAALSERTAIFMAANFSYGVNYLLQLVEKMAKNLKDDFDIEIIEAHHNQKVDAPSGTALAIADAVVKGANWDLDEVAVYGRKGNTGKRPRKQLAIHSVRGGGIAGDHKVMFASGGEVLEISHRALSRSVFAEGALKAAKFMHEKAPGMYTMKDLLS